MAETVQQYIERILNNVSGEPLAIQSSTHPRIENLIGGLSAEQLKQRPAPERWSIAEIIAHLADAEIVAAFRIRKILSEPGCAIAAYDQNAWAEKLNYRDSDPWQNLKRFGLMREMNLALLRGLNEEQWDRYGIHSERGRETLRRVVTLFAGHDVNHLKQIESIVKSRGELSRAS
jgi:hypothetical protein